MSLLVQKYGGTSIGSIERIEIVADKIIQARKDGNQVVVVVSAMNDETNRLIALANEIAPKPDPREYDVLLSTGEQVTIALLSIALIKRGCSARSYTGSQVKILMQVFLPDPGKRFRVTMGAGLYRSEPAVAIGATGRVTDDIALYVSVGSDTEFEEGGGKAGISFQW